MRVIVQSVLMSTNTALDTCPIKLVNISKDSFTVYPHQNIGSFGVSSWPGTEVVWKLGYNHVPQKADSVKCA